jgi:hypothetical protein
MIEIAITLADRLLASLICEVLCSGVTSSGYCEGLVVGRQRSRADKPKRIKLDGWMPNRAGINPSDSQ